MQRYLSDVEGQRLKMAGDGIENGCDKIFGEAGTYEVEGAEVEDIDREILMSQVRAVVCVCARAYNCVCET